MATNFTSVITETIGEDEVVIYQSPAGIKSIVIGCSVANKTTASLPVTLKIKRGEAIAYYVRNKKIATGDNDELMKGNKIVLLSGDQLIASSIETDSFSAIVSALTGVT